MEAKPFPNPLGTVRTAAAGAQGARAGSLPASLQRAEAVRLCTCAPHERTRARILGPSCWAGRGVTRAPAARPALPRQVVSRPSTTRERDAAWATDLGDPYGPAASPQRLLYLDTQLASPPPEPPGGRTTRRVSFTPDTRFR
jgi:hypothetical protein